MSESDIYLNSILIREQVDHSIVNNIYAHFDPIISQWANGNLLEMLPSGSFAKGTANKTGTDLDLFISLIKNPNYTTKYFYNSLFNYMNNLGYRPKTQNVSINVSFGDMSVDLVPGQLQNTSTQDHSLHCHKTDSWIKTNIRKHVALIGNSGCINEIRLMKLWRNQKQLDFPSFYLELAVKHVLENCPSYNLSERIVHVLRYIGDGFCNARFIDPANSNNTISDTLSMRERQLIKQAAQVALQHRWEDFVR